MRQSIIAALVVLGGLAVVGCSNDRGMDDRPPPAAPVEPYQDRPGVNHEEHGTSMRPNQVPTDEQQH